MIQAFFTGRSSLIVATVILCLLAAAASYLLTRTRHPRPLAVAGLAASVTGTLCLTFSGAGYVTDTCVYNRQILDDLMGTQAQLNMALFVPVGFLALLAFRLPLLAIAGSAAFSLTIEITQATVPLVARTCDSTDFFANTIGGVAGTAAAWILLRLTGRRTESFRTRLRPILWTTTGVFAANALTAVILINPVVMGADPVQSSMQAGTPAMRDAVQRHLTQAFGGQYRVSGLQYDSSSHQVFASIGRAGADLDWPGQSDFSVSLLGWRKGAKAADVDSYSVTGDTARPASEADAQRIARTYIAAHYPDFLKGAALQGTPIDDARLGWSISARRARGGVLMPMGLNVSIDGSGRVSALVVRDVPDPKSVPVPRITEKQAEQAIKDDPGMPKGGTDIGQGPLVASQSADGTWHPVWLFPTTVDGAAGGVMAVDAVTGKLVTAPADDIFTTVDSTLTSG